jgi:ribosome-associated toxin RatA of RatAB toxin-antitoxin module
VTTISRSALVPYSAQEMSTLVVDIESYPKFLPWCEGARILSQSAEQTIARLDIAYQGIHKSLTTRNERKGDEAIEMYLVKGPFSHLHGIWEFQQLEDTASKISLNLEFAFSNKMLDVAFKPAFTRVANGLVDSFTKRAINLYGNRE